VPTEAALEVGDLETDRHQLPRFLFGLRHGDQGVADRQRPVEVVDGGEGAIAGVEVVVGEVAEAPAALEIVGEGVLGHLGGGAEFEARQRRVNQARPRLQRPLPLVGIVAVGEPIGHEFEQPLPLGVVQVVDDVVIEQLGQRAGEQLEGVLLVDQVFEPLARHLVEDALAEFGQLVAEQVDEGVGRLRLLECVAPVDRLEVVPLVPQRRQQSIADQREQPTPLQARQGDQVADPLGRLLQSRLDQVVEAGALRHHPFEAALAERSGRVATFEVARALLAQAHDRFEEAGVATGAG
jgi:hypothetical protein